MKEEILGVVVAIAKVSDEAEMLRQANSTLYSLAATVHTKDYEDALCFIKGSHAKAILVNLYNIIHYSIPFDDFKESGIGAKLGYEGF